MDRADPGRTNFVCRRLACGAILAALVFGGPAHALTQGEIQSQVLSAMDTATSPCDDFYQYSCGNWIDSVSVPADEFSRVRGFSLAEDNIRSALAVLLQDAATNPAGNPDRALAGTYFAACMNAAGTDNGQPDHAAIAPLQPYFGLIDRVSNTTDFLKVAGQLATIGVPAVFQISLLPDVFSLLPPRNYIVRLDPADPGFYDGDIYRKETARNLILRRDLQKIIRTVLSRFGDTDGVDRHADDIIRLEALLSKYHPAFGRQPALVLTAPDALYRASRKQDWNRYFDGAGNVQEGGLLLFDRQFIKVLGNALNKFPVDSLQSYLRWKLIRTYRFYVPSYYRQFPALSPSFESIFPAGFSPAWKQCVDSTSAVLAETTGKLWVESQETDRIRALTASMMDSIRNGFLSRLPIVSRLSPLSIVATADKAENVDLQLGFPASWIDETGIPVVSGEYLANTLAANAESFRRITARVGQPVDRTFWDRDIFQLYPQTVNAAYSRVTNQIYIPLGIQQEPFAHPDYPLAMNYGGLGSVLGHEFIHGYDDGGHYFDSLGLFGNIWTRWETRAFNRRTQCLVRQYGRYMAPSRPFNLNGRAILTENIADNGGIRLAFTAFKAALPGLPGDPSGIGNLTQGQLFFVSYAQNFCEKSTPARDNYLASRSWYNYAPNQYRVIGSLSNSTEFAEAFACPKRSPMNPPGKCEVW